MRVSSQLLFDRGIANLNEQQAKFSKVGEQIASGRRVVNPSDDPQAASRALAISQSISRVEQFEGARVSVRNNLSQSESILGIVGDLMIRARTLITQASNDTLSNIDRKSIASELSGIYESLVGQANATDGDGNYIFAGYKNGSIPFVEDDSGNISYIGDNNVRQERVDDTRLMDVGENGLTIFNQVQNGAGYVAESGNNTGTLTFKGPTIENPDDPLFGESFNIEFEDQAGVLGYRIDGGDFVEYREDVANRYAGVSLKFEGTPNPGDSIKVGRGSDLESGLFSTLKTAIDVLNNPAETDAEFAELNNTLKTTTRKLSNNFDNVLVVRASLGSRLNELDAIDRVADQRLLNLVQTQSQLIDVDLVDAISEYTLRQTGLEAAQRSFADIGKLSLFDFL